MLRNVCYSGLATKELTAVVQFRFQRWQSMSYSYEGDVRAARVGP